ncbi:MAG: hypothetical protein NTV51_20370 [Verrucomicrobia bacterium]|nr:hypothetical protein [Verrucomicrobiota bacterium]
MNTKKIWWVTAIFLVVLLAVWRYNEAKAYASWLRNHTPTTSVKQSQELGIFASEVAVAPVEFELGGESYRVDRAWLEHRTYPESFGPLITRRQIAPEFILCVDIRLASRPTQSHPPAVRIKNANVGSFYFAGKNSVLFTVVGLSPPSQVVLLANKDGEERVLELKPVRAP